MDAVPCHNSMLLNSCTPQSMQHFHEYLLVLTLSRCTLPQVPPHPTVFVNPPRLSDFKHILNRAGFEVSLSVDLMTCYVYVTNNSHHSNRT